MLSMSAEHTLISVLSVAVLALVHCFGQHSKHTGTVRPRHSHSALTIFSPENKYPASEIKIMASFFCEVLCEETNNCECEERGKSLQIFVFLSRDISAKEVTTTTGII